MGMTQKVHLCPLHPQPSPNLSKEGPLKITSRIVFFLSCSFPLNPDHVPLLR